jgi:hypothetical protein
LLALKIWHLALLFLLELKPRMRSVVFAFFDTFQLIIYSLSFAFCLSFLLGGIAQVLPSKDIKTSLEEPYRKILS